MKRRRLIHLAQTGALSALATGLCSSVLMRDWQGRSLRSLAQADNPSDLKVQWLGHTCFLFTGGGLKVLVNPFRPIGCTAKYPSPKVNTDLVLISSRLLDEGSVDNFPGSPSLLYEPGVYQFNGSQIQGIRTIKDRKQGRQFGTNVAWLWSQAGIKMLHLGGLAGSIDLEERILIGRPDVLFVPVGGGPKSYTPEEARQAIATLKPKLVIPTHYKTVASDPATCDLEPLEDFLSVMQGTPVQRIEGNTLSLNRDRLPDEGPVIQVFDYSFGLAPVSPAKTPEAGSNSAPVAPSP
ncbi:MAG: MBL fold metallo-hydrolase [Oscillatoriales cyanobacterium RM1_1_9]|nr:MBL fold metallo-hydrolase [Oscillatoriales cyanobacterium SM2_3_0]NJO47516.1 MBL fold metallo-hydrolase [Oscillatoriales cyanobacterium RM2_1_1]NJO71606.1 MBL fold metallo-hydrolase [Oscillatoriales cyanobacterium RM1_1_9]